MNNRHHNYKAVAEFVAQDSVIVGWPPEKESAKGFNVENITVEMIRALLPHVEVICQCYYVDFDHAKKVLTEAGVDITNIRFVKYVSEDLIEEEIGDLYVEANFPRDYGAEVVMDDEGNRALIDFDNAYYGTAGGTRYSREGTVMQSFGRWHGALEGIDEIIFTRLISEGGDREFNGNGVMMCIEETEVNKRNPNLRRSEVEKEFKRLFNVEKIIMLPKCTYDEDDHYCGAIPGPDGEYNAYRAGTANGHIDEMCRFVSEDTVLLQEVTEEEAAKSELDRLNKERLDLALEVLQNSTTVDGRPIKIKRIPAATPYYIEIKTGDCVYDHVWMEYEDEYPNGLPDGSPFPSGGSMLVVPAMSYSNFLITNGIILSQSFWIEGAPDEVREKDEEARRILQECFPDKEIVSIPTIPLNLLGGGIHCASRQIPTPFKKVK